MSLNCQPTESTVESASSPSLNFQGNLRELRQYKHSIPIANKIYGYKEMIDHIRPEDFEVVYRTRNRFRFMGNGRTQREYDPEADLAFYLKK